MAALSIAFDILARDRASREFNNVGDAVDRTGKRGAEFGKKFGVAVAAGFAVAAAAAFKFGKDSVAAYVEAEQSSIRLDDALARFPKTNDVTRASFDRLNTALAQKTRFDDDATASGQAVLAQFKLTGSQIQELTPLLQDYAAKTGKDIPDAASTLGKALFGKGKALTEVGIKFKDTGLVSENFTQITQGLRKQVGGFAEKEGKTAAGQADILRNQFGELQEKVGGALIPVLLKLGERVQSLIAGFKEGTGFGGQLRDAFDKIKASVQENEPQLRRLGEALAAVSGFILTKVIPVVVDLAVTHGPKLVAAFEAVKTVMLGVASGALSMVGTLLGALGSVFNVLAKVPGPFQDNFKAAGSAVDAAKAKVDGLKVAVDLAAKPKTVKVSAETEGAKADIDSVAARIARLRDKTVTLTINQIVRESRTAAGRGDIPGFATGGTLPRGWAMTGERGPELLRLPGAQVFSNQESREMLSAGNGDVVQAIDLLRSEIRALPRGYMLGARMAGV